MKSTEKTAGQTLWSASTILLVLFVLLGANITPAFSAEEIVLDHIDGLLGGDTVYAEQPVRFVFRMTNTPGNGNCIIGFSHGFRVYEKNGNTFWPITFDTLSVTPPWSVICDGGVFALPFGVDGAGSDTAGFGGFRISSSGICDPFDQPVWYVETGSNTPGDTICIDSTYYPPGGIWLWSTVNGSLTPGWDGPHCVHITDPPFGPSNDTTESRGRFMIQVNPVFRHLFWGYPDTSYDSANGFLTSPKLLDPQTIIGHSDTLRHADSVDTAGVPVGIPSNTIGDPDFVVVPAGFQGPVGVKEIHTEVKDLDMRQIGNPANGAYLRAGVSAPARPISPGEVEWLGGNNFPAESFFDVYVELKIPDFVNSWGEHIVAANEHSDPLLIRAASISSLPPVVMYVHDTSNVVPVRFTNSNSDPDSVYSWEVGDILGYILLAGHGVDLSQDDFDTAYAEAPVGNCCSERGNVDGITSGGIAITVADLTFLVDWLFRGGLQPPCDIMSDVDGNGSTDVADLSYIVDYLFRGGPPPPGC